MYYLRLLRLAPDMFRALENIVADRDATEAQFAGRPLQIRNSTMEEARNIIEHIRGKRFHSGQWIEKRRAVR